MLGGGGQRYSELEVILLSDTSDPGCEVRAQFSGPTGSGCLRSMACF